MHIYYITSYLPEFVIAFGTQMNFIRAPINATTLN